MISWGAASTIFSVMLIWRIVSMPGMTQLKPGVSEAVVLSQTLDEPAVRRPDDPDAGQEYDDDDGGDPKINGHVCPPLGGDTS